MSELEKPLCQALVMALCRFRIAQLKHEEALPLRWTSGPGNQRRSAQYVSARNALEDAEVEYTRLRDGDLQLVLFEEIRGGRDA